MKEKLIVCEGLDGAGKTSTIKKMLETENSRFVYNKCIGSDSFIGRVARRFPSTFIFFLELIYLTFRIIKPNLEKGKIILQDRYDISVTSFIPNVERWYNRAIIKIFSKFLIKPDILVHFSVSLEERIKRLKKTDYNKYHLILIKNPEQIVLRENKYTELYDRFNGKKIIIDTTNKSVEDAAKELRNFIGRIKKNL